MKKSILSHDDISMMCMELSLFLHSGLDAGSALSLMAEEESSPSLRALLEQMSAQVDDGVRVAEAFRQAGCFPEYVCGLIGVGEESGRLDEALRSLAHYYDQRAQLERSLRLSLLHPAVLLLVMLAVIVVLLTQVMPIFNDVYAALGGELTGVAGGLLSLGLLLDDLMPVLCALLAAAVVFLALFAGSVSFRDKILGLWRRYMGNKGVSKALNTARFAQAMAMGLGSGLPVEEALELSSSLLSDLPGAGERCGKCRAMLEEGVSLAKALGQSELLPQSECRLLELGMRSGSGDFVMDQIAQRLSNVGNEALEQRIGMVEPVLVASACVLVGAILLSVMLPLMHIMTAIG